MTYGPTGRRNMSRKLRPLAALAALALISSACSNTAADTSASGGNPGATNHAKAVRFVECMRNNGVSAFPDPDASGALTIDEVANHSGLDPNAPAFKQALDVCKGLQPSGFTGHKRTAQQQQ